MRYPLACKKSIYFLELQHGLLILSLFENLILCHLLFGTSFGCLFFFSCCCLVSIFHSSNAPVCRCQVGLKELPKDSALGRLRGSDNVVMLPFFLLFFLSSFGYPWFEILQKKNFLCCHQVEIYSRCYQSSPLVIQGAGAGNDTTAAGVLADIIDLQDLFQTMA